MKTDRIKLLLAASISLTFLSGIITYYAIRESRQRLQLVFHTYSVIGHSNKTFSLLQVAEDEFRGYLLTRDSTFRSAVTNSLAALPHLTDSLVRLVRDNPAQTNYLLTEIIPRIERKKQFIAKNVDFLSSSAGVNAGGMINVDLGKKIMDSVRHNFDTFNSVEQQLLLARTGGMTSSLDQTNLIRYISFFLIAVVSLMAYFSLGRKQTQNDELIAKLEDSNQSLEEKIAHRTRELEKENERANQLNGLLQQSVEEMASFYEALQLKNEKTEDALKSIRDLYDNAPCGYHSISEDGTFVRMNERELNWLGYTREEVIGKMKVTAVIKPDELESYYADFAKFKKQGYLLNKEHTFIRKDKTEFSILLNATAIYDTRGNYVMSRGSVTDITERKQMERELVNVNEALVQLNDEKSHFLGIAAHDLRSPLQSILGLINLINLKNQNLTPEQLEYLRYIQRSCLNMQELINNLLDINRIEYGVTANAPEQIKLQAMSDYLLTVFHEQARAKNISLRVQCNDPGKDILVDTTSLSRVLENLISNAIKFSSRHTEVVLNIRCHEGRVQFDVIDQGQGIAHEDLPRLFKKFTRLQSRPTNGESSTGLGLSIVKELVQALRGTITVDSEINKGSKFSVELPVT